MLIGDVLATVAIVVFSGLSLWASGVLVAVLFPHRNVASTRAFEEAFWKTFLVGLVIGTPTLFVGFAILANPALRLFGFLLIGLVIAVALLGSGGLTKAVAKRVHAAGGATSEYEALAKGGLLVVLFAFLPLFGWLIVMPLILVTALGAGVKALFKSERSAQASEAA